MSANGISTLATKQAKQLAKLNLAALKRQGYTLNANGTVASGPDITKNFYRANNEYDITELPTQYQGNTVLDNVNEDGLKTRRPWVSFLPNDLFAYGEMGVWFDPGNIGSLFQDAAGTIPVTAAGQPVGKMLDMSGNNRHATQSTTSKRPIWRIDPYGYGYLEFDGVDDFMVTSNILWTGFSVNKVTASVGLLVDPSKVTAGVAICTGGNPNSVNGTFLIGAPSATADHSFYLRGTSTIIARVANAVVGDDILTGVFDLSQSTKETQLIPRLSGTIPSGGAITWTGTTAGGGTFTTQPLYIGSLGGTDTFFKGHIYGVVVRGALSNNTQITQTEAWINRKLD
jgi:hypothetical protein